MRLSSCLRIALILALAACFAAPTRAAEFIVSLAPRHADESLAARRDRAIERFAALGVTPLRALADGMEPTPAFAARMAARPSRPDPFDLDPDHVWLVSGDDAAAAALAAQSDVEWIEPVQLRSFASVSVLDSMPNDPLFRKTKQWGLWNAGPTGTYRGTLGADIHAQEAWTMSTGSNDVILSIADTGIDPEQPELGGLMPDGRARLIYPFNATVDPAIGVIDSFAHGTTVAGVMAARTNDGPHFDTLGVAGVCGGDGHGNAGCRLIPMRITVGNSGDATSFDIARAMVWATQHGARAMNLSFAGNGPSRAEREAMYYAMTRGCIVVAASGNSAFSFPNAIIYPAVYSADGFCIQVGASDQNDKRALFSSYGPGLDLVAPGVNVWTTFMTYPSAAGATYNGYVAGSGTSYAAPHVVGTVGLLVAQHPELTDTDFQHIIRESADDIGAPGVDQQTGHGRLNAAAALRAIPPTFGVWHDEVAATYVQTVRIDTLEVGESGPGMTLNPRTWLNAELLEVQANVALPDSFIDSVRVWPRLGGTSTVRGDFKLPYFAPWADVIAFIPPGVEPHGTFTLRGYLYRVIPECAGCDSILPLPLDQARIAFTVIGKVYRGPAPPPPAGPLAASLLRVSPNPAFGVMRIVAPGGGRLDLFDASGRRVRTVTLDAANATWSWDGRDDRGQLVGPGLYFAAQHVNGRVQTARFVRLTPR